MSLCLVFAGTSLFAAPDMQANNCVFMVKEGNSFYGPLDENSKSFCEDKILQLSNNPDPNYPNVNQLLQSFNGQYFVAAVPNGSLQVFSCMACGYDYAKPCSLEEQDEGSETIDPPAEMSLPIFSKKKTKGK